MNMAFEQRRVVLDGITGLCNKNAGTVNHSIVKDTIVAISLSINVPL